MDGLIHAILVGVLFTIMGGIFVAITRAADKAINKRKIEIEKGLNYDFGQETLSVEARMAIVKILARIAECDGEINRKAFSVWHIIFQILRLDNLYAKTLETIEDEFNKKSNDELLEYLSALNSIQKKWFLKATFFLMESDPLIRQKEVDYIQPILSKMGINKKINV